MNCKDYIVWMSGHLDGTNSEREEQTLQEHMKKCSDCKILMEEMKEHDRLLQSSRLIPPDHIVKHVMASVRKDAKKKKNTVRRYVASVAAMAAVLCLVLLGTMKHPERFEDGLSYRSMNTPTEALAAAHEELIADAYEPPLEGTEASGFIYRSDTDAKGGTKSAPVTQPEQFHCVFAEVPSKDLIPEGIEYLPESAFFTSITKEAQDHYLYGGSIVYGGIIMDRNEMTEWEPYITFRFLQEFVETDRYIVIFCSESR